MGRTMSFRVRRILYKAGSTHEDKRGPIIRMRVSLPHFDHGFPQGQGAIRPIEKAAVERLHEIRGTAVVDIPQCEKEILRPRGKEAPYQTDQFVSRSNHI